MRVMSSSGAIRFRFVGGAGRCAAGFGQRVGSGDGITRLGRHIRRSIRFICRDSLTLVGVHDMRRPRRGTGTRFRIAAGEIVPRVVGAQHRLGAGFQHAS